MEKDSIKESEPPIRVDDEIEVEIISKGDRGDGTAKVQNFIVFVPGTNVGDKVTIKVEKVFRKFGIARRMLLSEDDIKIGE